MSDQISGNTSEQDSGASGSRRTLSATSIVMGATLTSRLLGFVRIAVINAVFGASGSADVLNAVFNVPNNLRKLMAEGALSSAFIPVLSQSLASDEDRAGGVPSRVVRSVLTFQFLVLIPILVLSVIFARPVTSVLLDFQEPARQALAANLFRWFIHYTLLISISAVLMGSLNSSNRFTIPAFTPLIFSICVITSVLLLHRVMGVYAMAVGVLAGGMGQILFQTPQFVRNGFSFKPTLQFNTPQFRRILRHWLPVLASSGVFVVNQIVAIRFASGLDDGSTSALTNAVTFWQLPIGIFGASITTVLFPRMSREALLETPEQIRETIAYGVRANLALLIPASILLAGLSYESIAVVLQRGRFTSENTIMAARTLIAYCTGMASVGLFNFLQRSFYSRGDFRTPVITAGVIVAIDIALSLVLKETRLRVAGLAVANSIAFTVGTFILLARTGAALGGINGGAILRTLGKVILATAPTLAGLLVFRRVLGDFWLTSGTAATLGLLAAAGITGLGVVAILFRVLRIQVAGILLRRRKK